MDEFYRLFPIKTVPHPDPKFDPVHYSQDWRSVGTVPVKAKALFTAAAAETPVPSAKY